MREYRTAAALACAVVIVTLVAGAAAAITRDWLALGDALAVRTPHCVPAKLEFGPTGFRLVDGTFVPLARVRVTDDPRIFLFEDRPGHTRCLIGQ